MSGIKPTANREILSVSDLNRLVREILEAELPLVYVEGEISNLSRPASGHWYFSLKDGSAQIRCAMFRNRNRLLDFKPQEGNLLIASGRVSLYEGRGDFQLIVDSLEEAGDGALRRAFEKLKAKLNEQGLFDTARKKAIPAVARHIAVITSPTGAAVRDVLTVLNRRFPAIKVSILPVQVQGDQAPGQIADALLTANQYVHDPFDLIILTRGGGSLEDLWAFNTEHVALAIHASHIPVISAIGHEVDFTIADFIADLRAPTPSAAAEFASPDQLEWLNTLSRMEAKFGSSISQLLRAASAALAFLERRMRHPGQRIHDQAQRLDDLESRLISDVRYQLSLATSRLVSISTGLPDPLHLIENYRMELMSQYTRLRHTTQATLNSRQQAMAMAANSLSRLSPLATLERGYSITRRGTAGDILKSTSIIKPGDMVSTQLQKGRFLAEVREVSHASDESDENT